MADTSLWAERDSVAARALAREAAEEGIVLLINRPTSAAATGSAGSGSGSGLGLTLPLSKRAIKKIAVIGPNGDAKDNTLGDYNPNAAKSEQAWAAAGRGGEVVTVYGGLQVRTVLTPL